MRARATAPSEPNTPAVLWPALAFALLTVEVLLAFTAASPVAAALPDLMTEVAIFDGTGDASPFAADAGGAAGVVAGAAGVVAGGAAGVVTGAATVAGVVAGGGECQQYFDG